MTVIVNNNTPEEIMTKLVLYAALCRIVSVVLGFGDVGNGGPYMLQATRVCPVAASSTPARLAPSASAAGKGMIGATASKTVPGRPTTASSTPARPAPSVTDAGNRKNVATKMLSIHDGRRAGKAGHSSTVMDWTSTFRAGGKCD
ncbi:hypothetical protein ARMGADRAFT_331708 [Armillaria gallica]|uniref:Uncharacterized protein n=1 Tax=Armillaria gallica TaxID=47427 RepID=A0A2H3DE45_ARMGA|nr:hypothetical protein ARMGADRAFT_331708 [Armillaria gallica]